MEPLLAIVFIACFILIITIVIVISKMSNKEIMKEIELEGFEKFYQDLINSNNEELHSAWEATNRENIKRKRITLLVCFIVDVIIVISLIIPYFIDGTSYSILENILSGLACALITNVFIFVILNLMFSKKRKEYNKIYKKVVISKVISHFYSDVKYSPNSSIPEEIYRNLNYEYYDRYKSEDYFMSKINHKYDLEMAEVLTEEIKETIDSEGNRTRTEETVFHGLFAKINLESKILEELRIMPNGQMFLRGLNSKVTMDSSTFENCFDVVASDKIVAMQILTSDSMEQLIEIKKTLGIIFDIVIRNNELYLRFHSGGVFEPGSLKTKGLDKTLIKQYYYVLNATYTLANKLIEIIESTQL